MSNIKKILKSIINEEFSSKLVDINHAVNKSIGDFNDMYKMYANKGLYRVDCYIYLDVQNPSNLLYLPGREAHHFGVKQRNTRGQIKLKDPIALYSLYFYSEKSSIVKSNKVNGVYLMPSYNSKHNIGNDKIFLPNFDLDTIYKNGLKDNDRLVHIDLGNKKLKITNSKYLALYNKIMRIAGGADTYVVDGEIKGNFYMWIDNVVKYEDKDIVKNK